VTFSSVDGPYFHHSAAAGADLVINLSGADLQAGDLLVAIAGQEDHQDANSALWSFTTGGWSYLAGVFQETFMGYRICDGTEGGSYSITIDNGNALAHGKGHGMVMHIRSTAGPIVYEARSIWDWPFNAGWSYFDANVTGTPTTFTHDVTVDTPIVSGSYPAAGVNEVLQLFGFNMLPKGDNAGDSNPWPGVFPIDVSTDTGTTYETAQDGQLYYSGAYHGSGHDYPFQQGFIFNTSPPGAEPTLNYIVVNDGDTIGGFFYESFIQAYGLYAVFSAGTVVVNDDAGDQGFNEWWDVMPGTASDALDIDATLPTTLPELSDVDDNINTTATADAFRDGVKWNGSEWVATNTVDGGAP